MPYKITHWRDEIPATENEIRVRLEAEGMAPEMWSNNPGDTYEEHEHAYDKVVYCLKGMIRFTLPAEDDYVDLMPGDRLDLPAGTRHAAMVGPAGVTCLEGQK